MTHHEAPRPFPAGDGTVESHSSTAELDDIIGAVTSDSQSVMRWEWVVLAAAAIAVIITRLPTLDQVLVETPLAAFRQTQTAFQTAEFHRLGVDLLHPRLPVLGAPYEVPFEFPLFQAVAAALASWGFAMDTANRVAGLIFFMVSGGLLWLIVRHLADRITAAVALGVFAFSPFALFWSRSALMEYLAVAAALLWVWSAIRWLDTRRVSWLLAGVAAGATAALVKITTAAPWALLILLYVPAVDRGRGLRERLNRSAMAGYGALLAIPVVLGLLWTRHADAIKSANPTTDWLTSASLRRWNVGTVSQRLDGENFDLVLGRIDTLITGRGWIVLGLVGVLVWRRHRATWLGMLLVPTLAIGTFYNLYVQHEYYLVAVTPAFAAALALGIRVAADWLPTRSSRVGLTVCFVTMTWIAVQAWSTHEMWRAAYKDVGIDGAAQEIADLTHPDELVLLAGADWNPSILYYAERRGLMVRQPFVTEAVIAGQPDLDAYRLFYSISSDDPIVDHAATRPWMAPLSSRALRLGATSADLGAAGLQASTERLPASWALERPVELETLIQCGGPGIEIPPGVGVLWIDITSDGGRAVMGPDLISLPSGITTLLWFPDPGDTDRGASMLTCTGDGAIEVLQAAVVTPS